MTDSGKNSLIRSTEDKQAVHKQSINNCNTLCTCTGMPVCEFDPKSLFSSSFKLKSQVQVDPNRDSTH